MSHARRPANKNTSYTVNNNNDNNNKKNRYADNNMQISIPP